MFEIYVKAMESHGISKSQKSIVCGEWWILFFKGVLTQASVQKFQSAKTRLQQQKPTNSGPVLVKISMSL